MFSMRAPIKTVHDNYKCNKRIPLHSQFGKYFKDFNCLKSTNVPTHVCSFHNTHNVLYKKTEEQK